MSPRSIRRAAEHKARKLAAKQQRLQSALIIDADSEPPTVPRTEPRASASGPTGPRTPEGKALASLNALKTGLTGRTVLLPAEDAEAYASHIEQYRAEYAPVGIRETELVQSLADTSWRLRRIPGLEMAIYALGRIEFAASFDAQDPSLRDSMIELQTFLKYEKNLRNLHLQESRLRRRYTAETKDLRNLQHERTEGDKAAGGDCPNVDCPATVIPATAHTAAPREFEFSTPRTNAAHTKRDKAAGGDCPPTVIPHATTPKPREFEFSTAGDLS